MMQRRPFFGSVRARGTSLIEVLIALTLVAVTMLGLLGLQLRSMGMQKDSLDRRAAAMIVAGFGDRVAANYAGFEAGWYSNLLMTTPIPGVAQTAACATPASCTTQEIANRDLILLQNDVVRRLPGGMVFTQPPVGVALNTGVQVTVAWADLQRTPAIQAGTDQACVDARVDTNLPGPAAVTNTYRCYSAFVYP